MIAYILEFIIAGTVSYFLYDWHWWATTISFPVLMMLGNQSTKGFMALSNYRRILDSMIMIVQFSYVVSQVIIFQINIGSWYGWLIGIIVGWLMMGLMTPKRWQQEARTGM